ncbi:MAG: GNAT family N-acetyltransferase [Phycisphaerales bacterium]|nr:GNAT family N-acetyltransferase [Phycisphaerales bacterium]
MAQDSIAFELVRPSSMVMAQRGIACLMAGPEAPGRSLADAVAARMQGFLEYCQHAQVDLMRQAMVFQDGTLLASCLWVLSKGRTGAMYIPDLMDFPQAARAAGEALKMASEDAKQAEASMAQVMLAASDVVAPNTLKVAGYDFLARLAYLERGRHRFGWSRRGASAALPSGFDWQTWTTERKSLFEDIITKTYIDTADCPKLAGVRRIADVLAGHQAVGQFDPGLWLVLRQSGSPVGALLMARVPERSALEIVYLGVAPEWRGRGCGRLLLNKAVSEHAKSGLNHLSLAVDEANRRAVQLYESAGFENVGERQVFFRRLACTSQPVKCDHGL